MGRKDSSRDLTDLKFECRTLTQFRTRNSDLKVANNTVRYKFTCSKNRTASFSSCLK